VFIHHNGKDLNHCYLVLRVSSSLVSGRLEGSDITVHNDLHQWVCIHRRNTGIIDMCEVVQQRESAWAGCTR